jgi:hypothetical protein
MIAHETLNLNLSQKISYQPSGYFQAHKILTECGLIVINKKGERIAKQILKN